MSKFKRLIPAALLLVGIVSAGHAQRSTRADSVNFERPVEYRIFASNSPVRAFAVSKNTLWYATEELVVEQPMNAKTHKPHRKLGEIAAAGVKAMAFDSRGRLWLAGDNGAAMNSGGSWTSYTDADGLPATAATSLAITPTDEVWVGTEGGAARFNGSSWTAFTETQGLPSNKVQALATDSRGRVYMGTNRGLSIFENGQFKNLNAKNTGSSGLEWNNVSVLAKEPTKDIIWMTDGPANINSLEMKSDGKASWRRFVEIQQGTTSIMNDTRRTWFGSEKGLLRFNGEEWISDPNMHGNPSEQVFAMFRDDSGNLWFGMEKGVLMMNNPYRK